jgi:hypothetical protein
VGLVLSWSFTKQILLFSVLFQALQQWERLQDSVSNQTSL